MTLGRHEQLLFHLLKIDCNQVQNLEIQVQPPKHIELDPANL